MLSEWRRTPDASRHRIGSSLSRRAHFDIRLRPQPRGPRRVVERVVGVADGQPGFEVDCVADLPDVDRRGGGRGDVGQDTAGREDADVAAGG